ncbi:MAG: N-acetylmuramoyl-L-alanine amidase [Lactobacillus sp.]|jgi:N-acetylmuramoyl-L-alanine amidase|nr:N-acetylmuramoyl-L-alanine amidase [Lactobacillus sp.]
MKEHLLENYSERKFPISLLVLHCSAYGTEENIKIFNECGVSSHYIIDFNAETTRLVKEENRAFHAGSGFWRGISDDLNSRSIGIEVCHKTLGQSAFPQKQIQVLIDLCREIIDRYNIRPENIIGHSDLAPARKADPGHFFPWAQLADSDIGLWYNLKNADKINSRNIAELLAIIGYSTENVEASSYAFCRRFLPEYVQTQADILHLVDNVLPDDFSFMKEDKFLRTLKSVAYEYNNI